MFPDESEQSTLPPPPTFPALAVGVSAAVGALIIVVVVVVIVVVRQCRGKNNRTLECGPTRNVMAALSNIDGALCSTPQFC